MKSLVLAALLLLLPAAQGFSAAPFPFEDVNSNGVFDGGDVDLTAKLKTGNRSIHYSTPNSIVIPSRVTIASGAEQSVDLIAGKNITIDGGVTAGRYGSITVQSRAGNVMVGPRARLNGMSRVNIQADEGDVSLGANAQLTSTGRSGNLGSVQVFAKKALTFGPTVRVSAASGGIYLTAFGRLTAEKGLNLSTRLGQLLVWSTGAVSITGATIAADYVSVAGTPLSLLQSKVLAPGGCDLQGGGTVPTTTGTVAKGCSVSE